MRAIRVSLHNTPVSLNKTPISLKINTVSLQLYYVPYDYLAWLGSHALLARILYTLLLTRLEETARKPKSAK